MTHTCKDAHTMASGCSQGCTVGGVSLVLKHWKAHCSCSQGVPSFCMWAGTGLSDRSLGGGRDRWRLMCRQRGSLLCVSEAYKAASVCGGGTQQQHRLQCGRLLSSRTQNYFSVFFCPSLSSHSRCLAPPVLGESSSLQ